MDIKDLNNPIPIENVDFRVKSVSEKGYIQLLAYKDARVDMNILDKVVGALNWKREHTRDNKNCIVSIYDETKKEWVSKEDTGTESNTEQAKGLASDSFKRACFNWGIGRELYGYPSIWVKTVDGDINGKKATFNFKPNEWKWVVKYSDDNKVLGLAARDSKGNVRFNFGTFK